MTKTWTSAAEDAKTIRQTLKSLYGWTSRQVSVRAKNYSMGSSINVVVKDPAVNLATVERVAVDIAESIRRCGVTGEILSGGNRFVHVRHSHECHDRMAALYVEEIERAKAVLDTLDEGVHQDLGETGVSIAKVNHWDYRLWYDGRCLSQYLSDTKALGYAVAMILQVGPAMRGSDGN